MRTTSWSTQQLTEFLAAISQFGDEQGAIRGAVERASEALEAEVGALIRGDSVIAAVGFAQGQVPDGILIEATTSRTRELHLPGLGTAASAVAKIQSDPPAFIVLGRVGETFAADELNLLRGMARVLALSLAMLRTLEDERLLRAEAERERRQKTTLLEALHERQKLLEKSAAIQRAIARRAPLQDVLDAITTAAKDLLASEIVTLRMVDSSDPERTVLRASQGIPREVLHAMEHDRIGHGASGRAIAEGKLVVIDDYQRTAGMRDSLIATGVQTAMAAPVYENATIVGSLFVGSREPRRYRTTEQKTLLAFAQHASLALMDANTVNEMLYQALHDPLTGLPNRSLLRDRLEQALARARREGSGIAVLFLDVDRFKNVNDILGHAAGDELLIGIAHRIEGLIRATDTASRLGGDEFAVLLENVDRHDNAVTKAEEILDALRRPFVVAGDEIVVTASIGVALARSRDEDALQNADRAMYQAKSLGRDRCELFVDGMRTAAIERFELESALKRAIAGDELVLHYQPIVDLASRRIVGMEALIRWQHPERGLQYPLAFIDIAEDTGSIIPIGRWVVNEACRQTTSWPGDGQAEPGFVSVNLSARQLQHPNLAADVAEALGQSGLEAGRLMLEITETVLMQDTGTAIATLHALNELGVRLAIDDFGTGYSSLRYLQQLPLDVLKIAKPFVDRVHESPEDSALVHAIVELGRTFKLDIIGEGIELSEQRAALQAIGCGIGQGFLFAKPCPWTDLEKLLRQPHLRVVDETEARCLVGGP